jgi:hypothetical protein
MSARFLKVCLEWREVRVEEKRVQGKVDGIY